MIDGHLQNKRDSMAYETKVWSLALSRRGSLEDTALRSSISGWRAASRAVMLSSRASMSPEISVISAISIASVMISARFER